MRAASGVPLLELKDVTLYFGSVIALSDVSLRVMPGEGETVRFSSPRDAVRRGIATVFQVLATIRS